VKLSTENGPIKAGDPLMLSSLPGVAMKAKGTGVVIGTALEDFDDTRMYSDTYLNQFGDDMVDPVYEPIITNTDPRIDDGCYFSGGGRADEEPCTPLSATTSTGKIEEANQLAEQASVEEQLADLANEPSETTLVNGEEVQVGQVVMFVDLKERWLDESQLASIGTLLGTSSIETIGDNEAETIFDRLVALANNFVDGVLSIFELRADRIEVANELCVDGVCVTADDLRTMLDGQAEAVSSNGSPLPADDSSSDSGDDDSASDSSSDDDTSGASTDNSTSSPEASATTTATTTEETASSSESVGETDTEETTREDTVSSAPTIPVTPTTASTTDNTDTTNPTTNPEPIEESVTAPDTTETATPEAETTEITAPTTEPAVTEELSSEPVEESTPEPVAEEVPAPTTPESTSEPSTNEEAST
jgi:hypothetical protein